MLRDLAACVPGFAGAAALDHFVGRFPKAVTHFAPGSYDAFLRPRTSVPNLFAAGDWVVDAHGSFSQEKARSLVCQPPRRPGPLLLPRALLARLRLVLRGLALAL